MPIDYAALLGPMLAQGGGIDQGLGVDPPQDVPQEPAQDFQANHWEQFLEGLAHGLENQQFSRPKGFGGHFGAGLIAGLGGAGERIAARRAKFDASQTERRKSTDALRMKEQERYRTDRASALKDTAKEQRGQSAKQAEYERDNPLVTPELKAAYPGVLDRIPEGQRLDAATWREVQKRSLPESASDKRAAAAAERAATVAGRNADNQARLLRQTDASIINQMVDDYRQNPSITAYRTATQNLNTIKAAQKEPSGFGDLAMLIAYVRATEPGVLSVVRQEELQNVSQAVGKLQQYVNIPNQWVKGQRLTPEGRKAILRAATTIAEGQRPGYSAATELFKRRADRVGVDPSLIIQDYSSGPVDPAQFEGP